MQKLTRKQYTSLNKSYKIRLGIYNNRSKKYKRSKNKLKKAKNNK